MKYQVIFNGKSVQWNEKSFPVLPDDQSASIAFTTQLPEGYYRLFLNSQQATLGSNMPFCDYKAWLEPADIETKARCRPVRREHFYFNDHSNGKHQPCVNIDDALFTELAIHLNKTGMQRVTVKVEY